MQECPARGSLTVTAGTVALCRELGLRENLFFCDDPAEAVRYLRRLIRDR